MMRMNYLGVIIKKNYYRKVLEKLEKEGIEITSEIKDYVERRIEEHRVGVRRLSPSIIGHEPVNVDELCKEVCDVYG